MRFLNAQGYEAPIDTILRKRDEIFVIESDAYPFRAHMKNEALLTVATRSVSTF
jgi:hypothetical protein